ncbi:MAG: hypothetical protein LBS57_11125 [Treponema sp.]|jgi:hypothetical protein|nr:hypothetical protein [Treponema sp.]
MKKRNIPVLLSLLALLWYAGCENPAKGEKSGEAEITLFSIMGIEGTIDGNSVTVLLPWGTDLAAWLRRLPSPGGLNKPSLRGGAGL